MRVLLLALILAAASLSGQQYHLPPEKLQRAIEYSHARYWLHFTSAFYEIAVLGAILAFGWAARFRDWAEAVSSRRIVRAFVFVPLLLLTNDLLSLPFAAYSQHLELKFDQSIQTWSSWLFDWTKAESIAILIGVLLSLILYAMIRRSPRRWWFYFWLATLPIIIAGVFLEPFVIEPLFFHFEPLAKQHPALVNDLEKVVARGGLTIPPDRMFEMQASEKLTSLNAYVSGLGASQRVVVWDTTLRKLTTPEVLSVFGHEMGHYVLHHVRNSMILGALGALLLLYAGYRLFHRLLLRWGPRWQTRGPADWASLPALLLIAAIFAFLSEPVVNSYSRWQEHQADVFGLQVIQGVVDNPNDVTVHTFQVLGEEGLDEPDPNPFIEFWTYSHPSISNRIRFTQASH